MDYYNELNGLWKRLNHYMPSDPTSVDNADMLQLHSLKFLMGLNLEFEPLLSQLVHRDKSLTLKEALATV